MLKKGQIGLIVIMVLIICLVPLWLYGSPGGEEIFGGADGQAEEIIKKVAPDYKPWFNPLWAPPSGEIEGLLFALQAALGAGAIGYYLGYQQKKSRGEAE